MESLQQMEVFILILNEHLQQSGWDAKSDKTKRFLFLKSL